MSDFYLIDVTVGSLSYTVRQTDTADPDAPVLVADGLQLTWSTPDDQVMPAQPDPQTCKLALYALDVASVLGSVDRDQPVSVVIWADEARTLQVAEFAGRSGEPVITPALIPHPDPAIPPRRGVRVDLECVDYTVDLAELQVGDTPWDDESAADRLQNIADAAGTSINNAGFLTGYWQHPRDVDSQPAGQLIVELLRQALWNDAAGVHRAILGQELDDFRALHTNLVPNGTFDNGIAGWVATHGATLADLGNDALAITGTGAAAGAASSVGLAGFPVTAGQTYTARAHLRAATVGRSWNITIVWYNAAGVTISQNTSTLAVDVINVYTKHTVTATAPAGAVTAAVWIVTGSAAGEIHYLEDVAVVRGTETEHVALLPNTIPFRVDRVERTYNATAADQLPMRLVDDAGVIVLQAEPSDNTYTVPAGQVARGGARWTQRKGAAPNTVVLTGSFSIPGVGAVPQVAVTNLPEGSTEPAVTTTIESTLFYADDAEAVAWSHLPDAVAGSHWQADVLTWHPADVEQLVPSLFPMQNLWEGPSSRYRCMQRPVLLYGLAATQNPDGRTWYAGQLAGVELTVDRGRLVAELRVRRTIPRPSSSSGGHASWADLRADVDLAAASWDDVDPTITWQDTRLVKGT